MEQKRPSAFTLLLMRWAEPQLRLTQRYLKRANSQLDEYSAENTRLKNRNEELNVQVNRLTSDNKDLHHQVELLKKANSVQHEALVRMERQQKDLMDRVERLVARVVQLDTQLGNVPDTDI